MPRPWRPLLAAGVAALLMVGISFGLWVAQSAGNGNTPAFRVLGQAAYAMAGLQSVHIEARMRTLPDDNFELLQLDHDLIPVELWKRFGDPPQWRVEKAGRTVVMDGSATYMWLKKVNTAIKGSPDAGFVEWLKPLLDVEQLLDRELELAETEGSELSIAPATGPGGDSDLVLQVKASAQGDFANGYCLNTSVSESNHLRVYHLDAATKRLKSLQVFVESSGEDILAFETTRIEYDVPLAPPLFALSLPKDVQWAQGPEVLPENEKYAKMGPREAAEAFLGAAAKGEWNEVVKFLPNSSRGHLAGYKKMLEGMRIMVIGAPFQSGRYPFWFVPYEIRLKSGEIRKHNLSMRNDNEAGRYLVDGGI